jgi:branched-chain amino acid transport system permease protein
MSKRHNTVYWTGFTIIIAILFIAPLVLPEFWRRFLTEVLIWGLLAMSSDLLIGYAGMVSFGHSAFFGLGMYGAAAAILTVRPPNIWLALVYGLAASAAVGLFVAYFSTRLRDIYFAITTLIFSQIFYVIIFTWTEVTGGENGLTFYDVALVRACSGRGLVSDPAAHHPVALRHGAAVHPRERGAHTRHRLSG